MTEIISWFSIANNSGLNVVSLGTPGLKENIDEQILTGGMTAIQQMLGSELGKNEDRWIGGGDTTKLGRFRISIDDDEVVAQFLLMSKDNTPVPMSLVNLSEALVKDFTERLLKTKKWVDSQSKFLTLSSRDVLPEFTSSIIQIRKKFKLSFNDNYFNDAVIELFKKSLTDYESYPELVEISDYRKEYTYKKASSLVSKKKGDYLSQFAVSLLVNVIDKEPLFFVYYKKPKEAPKAIEDTLKLLIGSTTIAQMNVLFKEVIDEVLEKDVRDILSPIEPANLHASKRDIEEALTNSTYKRVLKKQPIVFLGNHELKTSTQSFSDVIDGLVKNIFDEFDLGNILASLVEKMYEKESEECKQVVGEFFREFALHFPLGMPNNAWRFLSFMIFRIQNITKTSVTDIIQSLDIGESHKKNISEKINEHIKTSGIIDSKDRIPVYTLDANHPPEEYLEFFNALSNTIASMVQQFFNKIVWNGENEFGEFIKDVVSHSEEFSIRAQRCYTFVGMYNLLSKRLVNIVESDIFPQVNVFFESNTRRSKKSSKDESYDNQLTPEDVISRFTEYTTLEIEKQIKSFNEECDSAFQHCIKAKGIFLNYLNDAQKRKFVSKKIDKVSLEFSHHKLSSKFESGLLPIKNEFIDLIDWVDKSEKQINNELKELKENKKTSKQFEKLITKKETNFIKKIRKIEITIRESKKNIEKDINNVKIKMKKEPEKLNKELTKIYNSFAFPGLKIRVKSGTIKKLPDKNKLLKELLVSIKAKTDYDVFTLNEIIADYSTFTIFSKIRTKTINKALDMVINQPGESDVVSMAVQDANMKSRYTGNFDFLKIFEKRFIEFSRAKLANILTFVNEELTRSFFTKDIPVTVIKQRSKNVLTVKIGNLDPSSNQKVGKVSDIAYVTKIGNNHSFHLKFPINKIPPNSGELTANQVIRWYSWRNVVDNKFKAFTDILEFSSATLGHLKEYEEFISFVYTLSNS